MSSSGARDGEPPLRLLLMCNANRCRSPMAAALASDLLARWGTPAVVSSCGVLEGGQPAIPRAVSEMRRRGLDISDHLSRQLDLDLLRDADLVIVMERRQLVSVAELDMAAVDRSFPLVELAALASMVGRRAPERSVESWISEANRARLPGGAVTFDTADDVPDPTGGSRRAFHRTAERVAELLEAVLGNIVGPHPHA